VILSILKFKEVISFNSVARVFIFKDHGLRAMRYATCATAIRINLVSAEEFFLDGFAGRKG